MDNRPGESTDSQREELAAAFGGSIDPLAAHAPTFERLDVDPFELFLTEVLEQQNPARLTRKAYERLFRLWRGHMAREERHPACPSEAHVASFVEYCTTVRDNQPDTARTKLRRLNKAFEYWQQDPVFPHPPDYNPFMLALSKFDLDRPPIKKPPRISIDELGEMIRPVTDIRERVIIVLQLKLGLRASELCNLRIEEGHVADREVNRWYPELGTHERLVNRPNTVYIPSRYERENNKSRQPRLLPIDDELQSVLVHYLLTRPDTGERWVIQSSLTHNKLDRRYVNRAWSKWFRPEYEETEKHRAVTSHYGRHRFTTYWQVDREINRELVKYMRGDSLEGDSAHKDGIDHYVHTYYEDIENLYREHMFKLGIG